MIVYLIVAIIALLVQFYPVKTDKEYWWRTVVSFIPLFLFLALRKDYGMDESGYHSFFDEIHQAQNLFNVNGHMEKGYAILNKIMPTYQALIAFISFINCWALSYLVYRYVPQKYSWLAVFLIFFTPGATIFFMISGIRNGLSASLLILSTYFLVGDKRRLIPFTIMGVIAASIHTSALAMFAVFYLFSSRSPISSRNMVIWLIAMIVAMFASLSALADSAMPIIDLFMGRYVEQVESLAEIADERGVMAAMLGIAFAIGIIVFLREEQKNRIVNEGNKIVLFKWALFHCFSFTLGVLGGRTSQYTIYFFIVATVNMFAYWKQPFYKYGYLLIVLYLYKLSLNGWLSNPMFPYWVYRSVIGDF